MCNADVLAAMRAVDDGQAPKTRIAAFVRIFQDKKRAAYKPELMPDWWPEGIEFAAPSKLSKIDCGFIVEAAVAHAKGVENSVEEDDESEEGEEEVGEAKLAVEKKEDEVAVRRRGTRARGRGKVEDAQVDDVEAAKVEDVEEEDGSLAPGLEAKSSDGSFGTPLLEKKVSDGSLADAPIAGDVGSPTHVGGIGNSGSSVDDSGEPEPDEMRMPPHVVTQVSEPVADGATSAARRDSGESAAEEDSEFSPDDIPLEALLEAAAFPSNDELDAMVEEGQRALDEYVARLNEERNLQKVNMARLLRKCQNDLDVKAQSIVLALDEDIQRMPAREYILGYGGDPEKVLEAGIIRGHRGLEEIFAPVAEGEMEASAAGDSGKVGEASPSRQRGQTGAYLERGAKAVATAQKMKRTKVAETPVTARRSTRNKDGAGGQRDRPIYARRRQEAATVNAVGMSTVGRLANRQETALFARRTGIKKTARQARETDVLLTVTMNGSPIEQASGAVIAPAVPGTSQVEVSDVDDEAGIQAAIATLSKRLADTRRRDAQASVRKMR